MNHKISRRIFNIGLLVTVAVALLGGILMKEWIIWVSVGIFALNFVQQLLFDRCPHCDEWFSYRSKEPDFCPRCGKKLD
ncbi:MAG: hypothetical protein IJO22_09025 [Oscillospiraceae bacterium]|nr:hypothetical protein [Oscillospiraceae bacterium]